MKIKHIFIALTIGTVVFSCGKTSETTNETAIDNATEITATEEIVAESEVSPSQYASVGSEMTDQIVTAYIEIKDALTETDAEMTKSKAESLVAALESASSTVYQTMMDIANKIADNDDVEGQRVKFEDLSKEVYELVKTSNGSTTVYKQYCPMAFDNKGAYWLSTEEQIANPYFGDKMLKCGSVKETIAANE